mgnify:FL=1
MPANQNERCETCIPDDLMALALTDPLIHRAIALYLRGEIAYVKILEQLVVSLVEQKSALTRQCLDYARRDTPPITLTPTQEPQDAE